MAGRGQKFAKQARMLAQQVAAGRKPQEGIREPSGRLSRSARKEVGADSVNEIKRVREAALAGMRDPIWGSELGRLFLNGKINAEQFRAGRQWSQLIARWRAVHVGPRINPKPGLSALFRVGSCGPGPGSAADILADQREQAIAELVDEVLDSFARGPTDPALVALRECCELDVAPIGYGGLLLLSDGLDHLVALWGEA